MKISDVKLVLRMRELTQSLKSVIYKQPKINHLFNKRIFVKINIPKLTSGVDYHINISGFRHLAGSMLAYILPPESNINFI